MSIAQSFYTWLTANSAIGAIVSDRIYPQVIPQHEPARPAITYSQEGGEYIEHLAGRSETRLSEFSVDCWAPTYLASRNLAETLQTELVGVRGAFGSVTAESVRLVNDFDGPPDNDTGLYRVSLRFEIAYY